MTARTDRRGLWLITAIGLVAVAAMARPLLPHGFVSGDQGVKLVATFNAIAHPRRPDQVDLPKVAGQPVDFVDRFFRVHGDHAHALQSPLFPVLTAPLVALLGLRGAYVLPAVSFALLLPVAAAISRALALRTSTAALAISAVLANPLFYYAFEFWEHLPAALALGAATALACRQTTNRMPGIGAGVLAALAMLLRPEAFWYAAFLPLAAGARRLAVPYAVGLAVLLGPVGLANLLEGGTVVGFHAQANLSVVGDRWLAVRGERLRLWVLPLVPAFGLAVAGAIGCAVVRRRGHDDAARAVALGGALALAIGTVARQYPADALWHAWPMGGLAIMPLAHLAQARPLWMLSLATSLGVWLTSTHDGGTQWGPRILMVSAPALIVLAARALDDVTARGRLWMLRAGLAVALVASGAWMSRAAYVDLRGWKRYYGTLVTSLGRETAPGGYIVTNAWWLDQIAAPLTPTRTFLVADGAARSTAALLTLQRAGVPSISLAWSEEPGEAGPISTEGTCYRITAVSSLPERRVQVATATCAP